MSWWSGSRWRRVAAAWLERAISPTVGLVIGLVSGLVFILMFGLAIRLTDGPSSIAGLGGLVIMIGGVLLALSLWGLLFLGLVEWAIGLEGEATIELVIGLAIGQIIGGLIGLGIGAAFGLI